MSLMFINSKKIKQNLSHDFLKKAGCFLNEKSRVAEISGREIL